jgi:isocitrate/isopropylmalate dehydrogenase
MTAGRRHRIAVIGGDGIGPEVICAGCWILDRAAPQHDFPMLRRGSLHGKADFHRRQAPYPQNARQLVV